jgi:hypothetical protein
MKTLIQTLRTNMSISRMPTSPRCGELNEDSWALLLAPKTPLAEAALPNASHQNQVSAESVEWPSHRVTSYTVMC